MRRSIMVLDRFYEGEDALYQLLAEAYCFERVNAHGDHGGINKKYEKTDEQARIFELAYYGDWE